MFHGRKRPNTAVFMALSVTFVFLGRRRPNTAVFMALSVAFVFLGRRRPNTTVFMALPVRSCRRFVAKICFVGTFMVSINVDR